MDREVMISARTRQRIIAIADGHRGRHRALRCHVREQLVAFVRDHYPEALPRLRAELTGDRSDAPHQEE